MSLMQMFCLRFFFFYEIEFSAEQCAAPNLNADTVLAVFSKTCYEFHVTRGESFEKAQQICKSHGKCFFTFIFILFSANAYCF